MCYFLNSKFNLLPARRINLAPIVSCMPQPAIVQDGGIGSLKRANSFFNSNERNSYESLTENFMDTIPSKNNLLTINMYRFWKSENSIVGIVKVPGLQPIFSLELPWRDNQVNISCIPADIYTCERSPSNLSNLFKELFRICNVPGRKDIIFGHVGNSQLNTKGCILFGLFYSHADYITESKKAVDLWMNRMNGINTFNLKIYQ